MSKKLAAKALLALGLFTIPRSVFAHHGAASYDNGKTITLTGTVTKSGPLGYRENYLFFREEASVRNTTAGQQSEVP